MMRSVRRVVEAFRAQSPIVGDSRHTTDGHTIFSYGIPLAKWTIDIEDDFVSRVWVAPAGSCQTPTTTDRLEQIRLALHGLERYCSIHDDCKTDLELAKACSAVARAQKQGNKSAPKGAQE